MRPHDLQPPADATDAHRILHTLAYFDVFAHPLREDELLGMTFKAPQRRSAARALAELCQQGRIERSGTYCYLPGRRDAVEARLKKEARAQQLWERVPTSVGVLSAFPFVRGLSITGTLAKDAVGEDADIDFVVFTSPDRVWLCRTLIAGARRMMPPAQRELCCANVFLSEEHLTYDQQTPYVAVEIGLSRPVFNPELGRRFFEANRWLHAWLPGLDGPPEPPSPIPQPKRGTLARALEAALGGSAGDGLEAALPHIWQGFWALKYGQLTTTDRDRRFRVKRELSTNHYNNFQARVVQRYRERLEELGLLPPAAPTT